MDLSVTKENDWNDTICVNLFFFPHVTHSRITVFSSCPHSGSFTARKCETGAKPSQVGAVAFATICKCGQQTNLLCITHLDQTNQDVILLPSHKAVRGAAAWQGFPSSVQRVLNCSLFPSLWLFVARSVSRAELHNEKMRWYWLGPVCDCTFTDAINCWCRGRGREREREREREPLR